LEKLYDLLFEVSNEYRHAILILLQEKPLKITEIAKQQHLTTQEVSRNVSRLKDIGLTFKDVEGFYHLSPFGELVHILLEEFQFISKHRTYFIEHSINQLQPEFVKRIGELTNSSETGSLMEFLHFVDTTIKEAKEHVWLIVDQYPLMVLGSIVNALKQGVRFKVIERREMPSGPYMSLETIEENQMLIQANNTPLVEQRIIEKSAIFMILSESKCAVAFPTREGKIDYLGFTADDDLSLKWCKNVFMSSWDKSVKKGTLPQIGISEPSLRAQLEQDKLGVAIVEAQNRELDAAAIQNAVDNYEEVILKGVFNLGTSSININRSVLIRGEGRKDGLPSTKIFKSGWAFPFTEFDSIFKVDNNEVDVAIENLHFTDFNCSCIYGQAARSLKIKNNAITLAIGYGRGWKFGTFGDVVTGIWLNSKEKRLQNKSSFPGGVSIEGNYLDFAYSSSEVTATQINTGRFVNDPTYRPNLNTHEYYIGIGINLINMSGKVIVDQNTIRNMNARGICATDNFADADIFIKRNIIESDLYGAYPFKGLEAGVGIFAQSAFFSPRPGFNISIDDNTIKLTKSDYCGIGIYGSEMNGTDVGALFAGLVTNNKIFLKDGQAGIQINSDNFDVYNNKITGEAYLGIQTSGLIKSKSRDSKAAKEKIRDNDVLELKIKDPFWRVRRRRPKE
jgi:predicted transcriptional regulator